MIAAIADTLAAADPARKDLYGRNAAAARAGIDALTADFKGRLAPLKDRPFIVFHDAYQYLEHRFGLTARGILAIDPDRPAGARHIAALRARMVKLNAACLFTEPQFPSRHGADRGNPGADRRSRSPGHRFPARPGPVWEHDDGQSAGLRGLLGR